MTGEFLSAPRYDWCAPLSHPSFCMLVNHGPSRQSSKEECQPRKWGATARYCAFPTKNHVTNEDVDPCQDPAGNRIARRLSDYRKQTQTVVVWSCLPFITSGQNHLARHSERGKKTRQTGEEMGRRHQGMDRPGVRQVPEDSREQGKMDETGCEIICGATTTLTVKG